MTPRSVSSTTGYRLAAMPSSRSACVAGAAALLTVGTSHALDWSNTPSFMVGAQEDSNLHMQIPELAHPIGSATLLASTAVLGVNERLQFHFVPQINAVRYDDPLEPRRNDASADAGVQVQGERQTWSAGAGYSRDGTLDSELESLGFSAVNVTREQSSIRGGWTRRAERGAYDASASAVRVDYAETLFSPFRDYNDQSLTAGYTRYTNERSSWHFGLTHMEVASDAGRVTTVSEDLRARWSHTFSPALYAQFGVGILSATTKELGDRLERTSPAVDFAVERSWPYWQFAANGGRSLEPDGRGTVLRQDTVTVGFTRRLAAHLSVGANWTEGRNATLGVQFDRDYSAQSVSMGWSFKRRWTLDATLQQRSEQYSFRPETSGTVYQVSVAYRGN